MTPGAKEDVDAAGVELRSVARVLAPGSFRTSPPPLPPGTVQREAAFERLAQRPDAACVLVNAPAGYGKTTILATLAHRDERPCAWLSLGRPDDDPTALLAHLLLALDGVEPVPDDAFEQLVLSDADLRTVRLPRLANVLARRSQPFLLVLDDAHRLATPRPREIVRVLAEHVPPGSSVAIATRDATHLGLARARATGSVLDIEAHDLAMSVAEGTRLLRQAGLDVADQDAEVLVEQTEGWPAALYLCALALRDTSPTAVATFGGSNRVVAEYLMDEVLATVEPTQLDFMLRTAILDRLSGPLCDSVLERADSAAVLDELANANRLVVPLDGAGDWYRYHHLFQDLLLAELQRRDPEIIAGLHDRASAWFDAAADADEAIQHAHAAGNRSRVTDLAWRYGPFFIATGRQETVLRWLEPFSSDEIAVTPALSVIAAWRAFSGGDTEEVAAWLSCLTGSATDTLPSGAPVRAAVALLQALEGPDTEQMRADAELAYREDVPESPYRPVAALLEGVAARLLGDTVAARTALERAVPLGALLTPSAGMHALAFLALMAADDDRWGEAESLAKRALRTAEEIHYTERPEACLPYSIAAFVTAHAGALADARDLSKHAEALLLGLRGFGPWITVEVRIQLARVSLFLGDVDEARRSVAVAEKIVADYPHLGSLPERVAAVKRVADAAEAPLGLTASPLTAAELRILRFLPTHLSFAQIAEELFVSRNTVKTQAIAVYRKLEVSSRAEAVEKARNLGLLDASLN